MKTTRIKLARAGALAVALALSTSYSAWSQVPEKGSAKGGAALLLKPRIALAASAHRPMNCAACKDTFVSVRDSEARGAGAKSLVAADVPTKLVAKHACVNCAVDWRTVGHGKAKRELATHKCNGCG